MTTSKLTGKLPATLIPGLEKHAGQGLQDVGLVNDGHLLSSVLERVIKCKLYDLAHRDVMFEGDIETAEIFSYENDVDIVESTPRDHASNRSHVGVKAELLAQANVDRSKSSADGRRQRSLQGKPRATDAVQGSLR